MGHLDLDHECIRKKPMEEASKNPKECLHANLRSQTYDFRNFPGNLLNKRVVFWWKTWHNLQKDDHRGETEQPLYLNWFVSTLLDFLAPLKKKQLEATKSCCFFSWKTRNHAQGPMFFVKIFTTFFWGLQTSSEITRSSPLQVGRFEVAGFSSPGKVTSKSRNFTVPVGTLWDEKVWMVGWRWGWLDGWDGKLWMIGDWILEMIFFWMVWSLGGMQWNWSERGIPSLGVLSMAPIQKNINSPAYQNLNAQPFLE